jgi:hypothetical protein
VNTVPRWNDVLDNIGAHENLRPAPPASASSPATRYTARTISSPIRNTLFMNRVVLIPNRFSPVLTTTKPTIHAQSGTAGQIEVAPAAATSDSNAGTKM